MGLDFIIPGLILILPVAVFDVWILRSTAKETFQNCVAKKDWLRLALFLAAGIGLGIWFTFFVEYKLSAVMRLAGFPIPVTIINLQENHWVHAATPLPLRILGGATDFVTGIAVAFLPSKISELFAKLRGELRGPGE